jgi:predicted nucleic acid-binding protein
LNASALVKRYVREPGAGSVRRLLKADPGAANRLSEVEVASALVRRAREGAFSVQERDRALASLVDDFAARVIVELTPEITVDARALLLRHRLRASDAVQLASCLYLQREMRQSLPFVAFYDRLSEAARQEGLTIASVPKGR